MSKRTIIRLVGLSLALMIGLLLASCQGATQVVVPTQGPLPTQAATTAPPTNPTPPPAATQEAAIQVPFLDAWSSSGHANNEAEAFHHWDEENPAEIPVSCAKCHSTPGFRDWVGADGTEQFVVNNPAPTGTVITCVACHNDATVGLNTVIFPSGVTLTDVGPQAVCLTCHQGTASMVQVEQNIEKAGVANDPDKVVADLGFTNIHYYAAAVSRYGTVVKGGFQYEGKQYDALFDHAIGVDTCVDCHNPHSLELNIEMCSQCHDGVHTIEDVHNIRMASSQVDYDGDGNLTEGIYYEVAGVRDLLYSAIQAYAKEVAGTPILYSPDSYPYFFVDTNDNGQVDTDEATASNGYKSWTARLAKAAYNLQTSVKDPGAYVHGGKYIIELLYDSTEDLNSAISNKVDLAQAHRIDPGHFAGSEEAFRHWDEEGLVEAGCVKCHTGVGLPQFLANGTTIAMPPSNGLLCSTCHDSLETFSRYQVADVTFPSGATLTFGEGADSNLCIECHQGREFDRQRQPRHWSVRAE